MYSKHWYRSKTLWFNFLALVGIILNSQFGIEMDAETQVAVATSIVAFVNLILRFTTKEPVGK